MTLRNYSYELLEIIRNAHIVDDERISLRLLDQFIQDRRLEWLESTNKVDGNDELMRQTMWVDMELDTSGHTPSILQSVNSIPTFAANAYGPIIDEIRGENHMAYHFIIKPFDALRWAGNGYFNQNVIFVSVHGKKVYLKSKDDAFRLIEKVKIEGIFADPLSVLGSDGVTPQITATSGDYPLNGSCFKYIKEEILRKDITFMLRLPSDETNDGSGDLIVG